ncbi:MAG: lipopolysaccharide heptosyltransferase II [Chlamydiales bacterium]|nr:lipopolysaccharide heptosyltransferase II [Chlamydiales bacterium]
MNIKDPKNIIVRMPNWLGDAVMATPILEDLRRHFPGAFITAMLQENIAPLLQKDPNINELFAFSKPSGFLRRIGQRQIVDKLQRGHYDLGVLLTNSFSSAWWFWRGNIKVRIGYANDWRSFLLTHVCKPSRDSEDIHLVDRYKGLYSCLDLQHTATIPRLYLSKAETDMAKNTLTRQGFKKGMVLVGINPGAAFGPAKCWPAERYRMIAKQLLEDESVFVVFFGDSKSLDLIKSISAGLPKRVCNLAGLTSLRELMALIGECSIFLTNDSGPMHIAAALQTPLLALFGSTNEKATGPYGFGKVIHKHVECSPCYLRTCPIDFRCMNRIEVDEVYKNLQEMIARAKEQKSNAP